MSFNIPTVEPLTLVAGDRIQWKKTLSDFPAPTWTLTYYLAPRAGIASETITAIADGTRHSVDVAPAVSAQYAPGDYSWQAFASTTGDRKLVGEGLLTILPDPSVMVTAPVERRSWARRCRDNLRDVLEGKASRDTIRYVMQSVGRSEDKFTWKDILEALSYFEGLVAQEDAENPATGTSDKKNILIRFR